MYVAGVLSHLLVLGAQCLLACRVVVRQGSTALLQAGAKAMRPRPRQHPESAGARQPCYRQHALGAWVPELA